MLERRGGDSQVETERGAHLVQVRVRESDVVVAGDAVSQGGEALVDALDDHLVGQAVPQVLDLCEHEKTDASMANQTNGLSVEEETDTTRCNAMLAVFPSSCLCSEIKRSIPQDRQQLLLNFYLYTVLIEFAIQKRHWTFASNAPRPSVFGSNMVPCSVVVWGRSRPLLLPYVRQQ
jgi:hypothetical protein